MPVARRVRKSKNKSRSSKPTTSFSLPGPDERNEPPENFLSYCSFIYGESSIGKTSLAAEIDGAVVLQFDPKRKNLRIRQVEMEYKTIGQLNKEKPDLTPWQIFVEYLAAGYEDDTVQAIIIDNVSKCYESCMNHVCYENGHTHPNDAKDYGQTWKAIADEFESTLNTFRSSDKGLILISHGHFREVTPPHGDPFDRWEPDIPKKAFEFVKANCDFVFNYHMHEGKRCIMVRSDEDVFTKCSVDEHFMSPSGNQLRVIDAGSSPAQAWSNLQEAYKNKVKDISEGVEKKVKKIRKITS